MRRHRPPLLLVACVALGASGPALAQIPDTFTNLKILPKDIGKQELVNTMREFAGALGVRCSHCHVGGNPQTLEGYDFATDEKETKRVARLMMKMMNDINTTHLAKIGRAQPLQVGCVTCHHGIARPRSLHDVMLAAVREDGPEAAVKLYRELRGKHHGGAAYDFGPGSLNGVTEELARADEQAAAEAIIRLNIEFNPDSAYSHFLLSRLQHAAGDLQGAVASMERAVAAEPDSDWFKKQLERARAEAAAPPAAE